MKTLNAVLIVFALPSLWGQNPTPATPSTGQGNSLLVRGLNALGPEDPAPISKRQRFNNYIIYTVGPMALIGNAAAAGLQQAADSPHEWGQGGEGYGKRFGHNMAY